LERKNSGIYLLLFVPSLFKKGLSENPWRRLSLRALSPNPIGVINRRNGWAKNEIEYVKVYINYTVYIIKLNIGKHKGAW